MLLLACARPDAHSPDDPARYTAALAAIAVDPQQTVSACAAITAPPLQADCLAAGAEALAATHPDKAQTICAQLDDGLIADECWFMVAEQSKNPALCSRAGRFREDCALHLLQQAVAAADPRAADDARIPALITTAGFETTDPRALTLVFRHALARQQPLDLSICDASVSAEWCIRAGGGLLNDRLNRARDTGAISEAWCSGDRQDVESVRYVPHPELDAVVARRDDLCP